MSHRYVHKQLGHIEYYEKEGDLWYSYLNKEELRLYRAIGIVPAEVIEKGKETIASYVAERVKYEIDGQKQRVKEQKHGPKKLLDYPDLPIATRYEGVILSGRIVFADGVDLIVELEEPYQGRDHVHFGMWSHNMYESPTELSEYAFESGNKLMIQIYQKEVERRKKFGNIIDLADQLNDESE